ncbi:hypothetical protein GGI42DRAFT_123631 [Trichoderma sp. SZMC 28013]
MPRQGKSGTCTQYSSRAAAKASPCTASAISLSTRYLTGIGCHVSLPQASQLPACLRLQNLELSLVHLQGCMNGCAHSRIRYLRVDMLQVTGYRVSQLHQNAYRKSNSPFARYIESTLRREAIDGCSPWGSRMYRNLLRRLWLRLAALRPVIRNLMVYGAGHPEDPQGFQAHPVFSFGAPAPLAPLQSLVPRRPVRQVPRPSHLEPCF